MSYVEHMNMVIGNLLAAIVNDWSVLESSLHLTLWSPTSINTTFDYTTTNATKFPFTQFFGSSSP